MDGITVSHAINQPAVTARNDAWVSALRSGFGHWETSRSVGEPFSADLHVTRFARTSVIECQCGANGGFRHQQNVRKDDEPRVAVQLVVKGEEHFSFGDDRYIARTGDIVLWNSLEPMSFEVPERLHKVTVVLPEQTMARWLPRHRRLHGRVLTASTGAAALLRAHMLALREHRTEFSEQERYAVETATLEMIAGVVSNTLDRPNQSLADYQLSRAQCYILENLGDCALTLDRVAAAVSISRRYLHKLFESTGMSPRAWIQDQRLLRAREYIIGDAIGRRTITSIAFDCGFSDSAHFSRAFTQRFGLGPRAFRSTLAPK
ncbi:helix-turn-helix domain-containing protein [Hwanghaeella grinnelliae]|uniref:Helix-turn-helix domain-containing protein n=1 Tax=Hwanghaeella grinnelliae TaxID=2500179 RepID=A0A3S2VNS7_9PROT|nr:helix-turn-helix domain-containing protein [Hwanghaeella grinnelliae]RVU35768.1 helix-turn-helix domain-containing protein [Hwanghaeella grinnelliae]